MLLLNLLADFVSSLDHDITLVFEICMPTAQQIKKTMR